MTGNDRRRPLVIGIGNRYRSDDGIGAAVLDVLADTARASAGADLIELDGEPTRLIDAWSARRLVIVIDAVVAEDAAPGEVIVLRGHDAIDPDRVARWHVGVSGHSAGLAEALRLATVLQQVPADLCIVGVVVESVSEGTALSAPVAAAVPCAVDAVLQLLTPEAPASGAEAVTVPSASGGADQSVRGGGSDVPG